MTKNHWMWNEVGITAAWVFLAAALHPIAGMLAVGAQVWVALKTGVPDYVMESKLRGEEVFYCRCIAAVAGFLLACGVFVDPAFFIAAALAVPLGLVETRGFVRKDMAATATE